MTQLGIKGIGNITSQQECNTAIMHLGAFIFATSLWQQHYFAAVI